MQRDSGLDVKQSRTIQCPHESLGGQLLVAVLFHVEINKLRRGFAVRPPEFSAVGGEK